MTIFQTRTRTFFDVFGSAYDLITGHDLWAAQNVAVADVARRALGRAPRTLLDVGCGTGVGTWSIAAHLPGCAVTGIDLTPSMIARATDATRRRPHTTVAPRFLTADATALPCDDGAFDVVVGASVLYLVPDADRVLTELLRVLVPGGAIAFLEPHARASLRRAARAGLSQLTTAAQAPTDTAKLIAAMVAWRTVSAAANRPPPEALVARAERAGFVDVTVSEALGGLGVHLVARRAGLA